MDDVWSERRPMRLITLLLIPCMAFATTKHVATTGNDGTGDGSSGNPYLTFAKAASTCSAGDTVRVHQGVYTGVGNEWNVPSHVTAVVVSPDTVSLQGMACGIRLNNKHEVKIDGGDHYGLRIRDVTQRAIKIVNLSYRCHIRGVIISVSSSAIGSNEYIFMSNDSTTTYANNAGNIHGITLERIRATGDYNAPSGQGACPGGLWSGVCGTSLQTTRDMFFANDIDTLIIKDCFATGVNHYAYPVNTRATRVYLLRDTSYFNHGGFQAGSACSWWVVDQCYSRGAYANTERAGSNAQFAAGEMIIRNSIFAHDTVSRGLISDWQTGANCIDDDDEKVPRNQRWYHNTFTAIRPIWTPGDDGLTVDSTQTLLGFTEDGTGSSNRMNRNHVVNNILAYPSNSFLLRIRNSEEATFDNDSMYVNGNAFYNQLTHVHDEGAEGSWGDTAHVLTYFSSSGWQGYNITTLETLQPRIFGSDNIVARPVFVDTTDKDFVLDSTSTLIGAAAPLTLASGNGVGSSALTVDDGKYFYGGWASFAGVNNDSIVIGAGAAVGISAVSGNNVTLTSQRTWSDNDEIYLHRGGMTYDDIGAVQYNTPPEEPPITPTQYKRLRAHR